MATNLSPYVINAVLAWLTGVTFPAAPGDVYVALFNGDPLSGGSEVTSDVRAAGRITVALEAVSGGSDVSISSNAEASFGPSDGDVSMTHVAFYDAASGGNRLFQKSLGGTVSVVTGQEVKINSGGLTISGTAASA